MNLSNARTWYFGAGLLALLLVVAGWFLLVAPTKGTADDLAAQTVNTEAANVTAQAQLLALKAQAQQVPAQQKQIAAIRTKIPTSPALPSLIRGLSEAARTAGVQLQSLTPTTPALLAGQAAAGATGAVATAPGQLTQVPVDIAITGDFANVRLFLNRLEGLPRSLLVTGLQGARQLATADDGKKGSLEWTINARVFLAAPGIAAPAPSPPAPSQPAG